MKKLLLVLVSLMFLTGCGLFEDRNIEPCSDGFHLEGTLCVEDLRPEGTFTSADDIYALVSSFRDKQSLIGMNRGWFFTDDVAMEMDGGDAAPTSDQDQGSDDYSETNNQVEGVDEMDNVLTDGKYIYIANYNKIQIALAYTMGLGTDALSLVKEITFDELQGDNEYFYFNGMYVDEDRLLVIGNSYEYYCNTYYEDKDGETTEDREEPYYNCWWYEYHSSTLVFEYSLEDFELVNEYELSGNFVGSRKIGDSVYFVTNEYIPMYYMDNEDYDFSLDTYLPSYRVNDSEVSLSYQDILYIDGTEPTNFTTFFGLNLTTNEVSTEVVLGEGGYNLYVSIDNIYLTNTKWDWNDAVILDIEEAVEDGDDDFVPDEDPYEIMTSIIRIEIDGGVVDFAANGDVPGMGLDQFAMDETDGYVRIVTTENSWWWGWNSTEENTIDNRLMVLDMDLNIVSTLDNIGKPGESVQSVRFVGDFAYVVTFLRTDPFYVIDVSDPMNPTKLSELEIPGFSDYLQPIGENYILGIGYGDNEGGTNGLKISLYDVSDKSNAVVASELIYPYSNNSYMWTSTLYNHKDLLVSIEKGIIALPYTTNEWSYEDENDYWWSYRTGILVLNLDLENGTISERGRVEHSATNSYDTYVYKSKFISDYLYTISSKYIKVSTLLDPETILNELLIGTPIDIEVPGEVEPVDPDVVNPDPDTCEDGTLDETGTCIGTE